MVKQILYALNFLEYFESMVKKVKIDNRKLDPDVVLDYIRDLRDILYGGFEEVDSDGI